jgi:pimeloyl-ACP methyl ester carboxylesterase
MSHNDDRSGKQRILFLPGLLCSRELFTWQIDHLPEPFQTEYTDLPPLPSMEEIAGQLWQSLQEQQDRQEKTILCGLSLGGIVAMEMFRQHPERVEGLILMNTNALDEDPETSRRRFALAEKAARLGPGRMALENLMPVLVHPEHAESRELRETIFNMAEASGLKRLEAHARALACRRDYTPILNTLRCPVLIIAGKEDLLCPAPRLENLRKALPHGEVTLLEKCGHLSTLERPKEVAAALHHFLQKE